MRGSGSRVGVAALARAAPARAALVLAAMVILAMAVLAFGCTSGTPDTTQTTATPPPPSGVLLPAPAYAGDTALWGFVDEAGTWAIEPQFENAYRFREGLAPVRKNGKWGYVDPAGQLVIEPRFVEAYYFNGGLARVATGTRPDPKDSYFVTASEYGFIDKSGKMVIPNEWDDAGEFSGGLAPVMKGTACGFIDTKGKIVIPLKFSSVASFSEGLAPATTGDLWGYIDATGRWAIQPQYGSGGPFPTCVLDDTYLAPARHFADGLAPVSVATGGAGDSLAWQFVDKTGRKAFELDVSLAGEFSEGLAPVLVRDQGWGFVDTAGTLAIEPRFKWTYYFNHDSYLSSFQGFHEGRAAVVMDGKVGYIDKNGTLVVAPQFAKGNAFSDGYAFVQTIAPSTTGTHDQQFPALGAAAWIDLSGKAIYQAPNQD